MAKVLVIYQTKYGQTEKIARFIAEQLRISGHMAELLNVENKLSVNPQNFDAFIVGGALYGQKFPKKLKQWIGKNLTSLNRKPSAFFGVCLAAQQKDSKVRANLNHIMQKFMIQTEWKPSQQKFFAGSLTYTKYGWAIKQMMKFISRSQKGPTDVGRDYEYTDWNEVSMFARDFIYLLPLISKTKTTSISP